MIKYHSQKQLIGEELKKSLVYVSRGLNVHIGRGEWGVNVPLFR